MAASAISGNVPSTSGSPRRSTINCLASSAMVASRFGTSAIAWIISSPLEKPNSPAASSGSTPPVAAWAVNRPRGSAASTASP